MENLKPIRSVIERDVDLLLLEEFHVSDQSRRGFS